MNKREPVTITLGGLPSSKGGRKASYSDLENFTAATGDLIREHYLYPNGSVISFGYDVDGYLRVSLWNSPPPPENCPEKVTPLDALTVALTIQRSSGCWRMRISRRSRSQEAPMLTKI